MFNIAHDDPGARARAIGLFAGSGGVALGSGPLAGGALIAMWRAIFFINLPICALGIVLALRIGNVAMTKRHALDPVGQIAAIAMLGSMATAPMEGRSLGWLSPGTLGLLAAAAIGLVAFLAIESRVTAPMVPLAILRRPAVAASAAIAATMTFCLFGLIFVFNLYFPQVRGDTPLAAGTALLPATASVNVTNILSGWLGSRFGTRLPLLLGLGVAAVGFLALLPFGVVIAYVWLIGPLLALGVAGGLATPAVTSSLMDAAHGFEQSLASGILNAARQIGTVLGVALLGALIADKTWFVPGMEWDAAIAAAASLAALAAALRWLPADRSLPQPVRYPNRPNAPLTGKDDVENEKA